MPAIAPFAPAPIADKNFLASFRVFHSLHLLGKALLYTLAQHNTCPGEPIPQEVYRAAYCFAFFSFVFFAHLFVQCLSALLPHHVLQQDRTEKKYDQILQDNDAHVPSTLQGLKCHRNNGGSISRAFLPSCGGR